MHMKKLVTLTFLALIFTQTLPAYAQRPFGGGRSRAGANVGDAQRQAPPAMQGGRNRSGSRMSPTQQQNIQKLQADLQAIKQGSQVTPEMKQALKNDLMAMADGATKPDQALVQALANDLSKAMADSSISNQEKAQLTKDLYAVMNSANVPASEVNQAISDAKTILTASNVSQQDVQTIVKDLKAIGSEAKNHQSR